MDSRTAVRPVNRQRTGTAALALSVVSPCYNEEESIGELYRRLVAACRDVADPDTYEIVLVNDGSRDSTWERMQELARQDRHVVAVNLSRNHGHQLALSAGLSVCRGDRILIIDADLQDPPELLTKMMAAMDAGADVVYGQRQQRAGETWFKKASAAAFYRVLSHLADTVIPLDTGDFRLMSRRTLNVLLEMPEQHRFIRGMVSWIGFKQVALPYDRAERLAGETKYPLHKMIRFALDAITGFSIKPLRIGTYIGISFAIIGIMLLVYTIFSWITHGTVLGWTSLMSAVLIMSSVQLLVLGVMGEYLGRLYMQAKHRPLFMIADIVSQPKAEPESSSNRESAASSDNS